MKKKLLSLIAVSAALATAGSALIACGGDDGNNSVKTEVTKEQWTAAFNIEQNFTSNFKVDTKYVRVNDEVTKIENITFAVGPEKLGSYSVLMSESDENGKKKSEQELIAIIGTKTDIGYSRKGKYDADNKWVVGEWLVDEDTHREVDLESWTHMLGNMNMNMCVFSFADKYDSFKYESNQYVLTGDGVVIDEYSDEGYSRKETAEEVIMKFANNKLTYVEIKTTQNVTYTDGDDVESDDYTVNYTYNFTYGGQKITAPKVENK